MELINMLIHANANINRQYNDGASPLMRACYYNYTSLVGYLLEHNANIECKNVRNETPLYIASFRGFIDVVKILVDKFKANVNCEDIDGDTPLSVACYEERTNIISYLLKKGAIVNKRGIRGDTPLHIAVSNCTNESVVELIKYGANVDALNDDNETPLHIVTRQNRIEILNTLLLYAKKLDVCSSLTKRTPFKNLMDNIQIDKIEMAIGIIKAGCNVNLSFNQFSFTCANVIQQTSTSIIIRNQTEYSQTFSLINSKESPFKVLFKINKSKFRFYEKLNQNQAQINDEIMFDFSLSNNSAFRAMLVLVDLIFKAGYRINQNDTAIYKDSWLFNFLSMHDLKTKALFDYYFIENLNKPSSLVNLCRARIRSCLVKPIFNSIALLHIPIELKSFLNLEF
jgi:ankyrin repeat protein